MTRLVLKHVSIKNIKGVTLEQHLHTPRVVLVGANGSGKSAFIDAIRLPIVGSAASFPARRDVKSKAHLEKLATAGAAGGASAEITLSDGTKAHWALGPKGSVYGGLGSLKPRLLWGEVDTALSGSPWKAISWFLSVFLREETAGRLDQVTALEQTMAQHDAEVKQAAAANEALHKLPWEDQKLFAALETWTNEHTARGATARASAGVIKAELADLFLANRAAILSKVQRFAPKGLEVDFLVEGTSFFLGYKLNGAFIAASSGAQWAMLVSLVALAAMNELDENSVPIIILPDVDIDQSYLKEILGVFTDQHVTVVVSVASAVKKAPQFPGWEVVHVY